MWLSLFGAVVVSTGCRWCRVQGLQVSCGVCSVPFFLPFVPLLLCSRCVACKYGSISRFKGVFRGFCGADVYLYGLRALRGLWGFCTREWLGGLKACGVFASMLSSRLPFVFLSCPLVLLSPALLLGFLPCLLSCSLSCLLGFVGWLSFPFGRLQIQKERAQFLASSLGVL